MRVHDGSATHILLGTYNPEGHPDIYPFYTFEKGLHNTISYESTLFSKRFKKWEGRAYAVNLDKESGELAFSRSLPRSDAYAYDSVFTWGENGCA